MLWGNNALWVFLPLSFPPYDEPDNLDSSFRYPCISTDFETHLRCWHAAGVRNSPERGISGHKQVGFPAVALMQKVRHVEPKLLASRPCSYHAASSSGLGASPGSETLPREALAHRAINRRCVVLPRLAGLAIFTRASRKTDEPA